MTNDHLSPGRYSPTVAELLVPERLNELGVGQPNESARGRLESLADEPMWPGHKVLDPDQAAACRAGLWLLHDFLDESHAISQSIDTATGSYWHGIMHRREGDFDNAKYWFRRAGSLPIFEVLAEAASRHRQATADSGDCGAELFTEHRDWNPLRFVDLCAAALRGRSNLRMLCRTIQQHEWRLLFDDGYRRAVEQ